jgi:NAD(P)-dependent dehydrogenase (short-subunit alcohol dehydrogenase family)
MFANPMSLDGRRVLVTGASSGIGRETAILLSQLGARLVIAGRDGGRLDETLASLEGAGHQRELFDLAAVEQIPAWVKALAAGGGPLNGVVHSAGIHGVQPVNILSSQKLEQILRVNVVSAAMLARGLRQKGCFAAGASLVFLSSVAGLAGDPGIAAYSASKAALIGLMRSLAMELAGVGIRVNCVAPGMVKSPLSDGIRESLTAEQFAAVEARHPLGLGSTRDVAHAVAFLVADTGRWITGSTLIVDGGFTAH